MINPHHPHPHSVMLRKVIQNVQKQWPHEKDARVFIGRLQRDVRSDQMTLVTSPPDVARRSQAS